MQRAIYLAKKGLGHTAPNPLVGAVIVYQDRIIGEGYHQQYGQVHAEVNAIKSVSPEDRQFLKESTLYVTLEPCSHHGKTPPCADLIIKNKILRVVIGSVDSNPKVSGAGIQKLKQAGTQVQTKVEEKKCLELNKRFFTYFRKKRPYIILKWAMSADGYIALPGPKAVAISSPMTSRVVHRWRSEEQAILIGAHTAQIDNPRLTNRLWSGASPLRIVLDRSDALPDTLHLFRDKRQTLIYTQHREYKKEGAEWIKTTSEEGFLGDVLADLYQRKITSVIIEGGTKTLQSFLDKGIWDECRIIKGNKYLSAGLRAPNFSAKPCHTERIGEDELLYVTHETC